MCRCKYEMDDYTMGANPVERALDASWSGRQYHKFAVGMGEKGRAEIAAKREALRAKRAAEADRRRAEYTERDTDAARTARKFDTESDDVYSPKEYAQPSAWQRFVNWLKGEKTVSPENDPNSPRYIPVSGSTWPTKANEPQ